MAKKIGRCNIIKCVSLIWTRKCQLNIFLSVFLGMHIHSAFYKVQIFFISQAEILHSYFRI